MAATKKTNYRSKGYLLLIIGSLVTITIFILIIGAMHSSSESTRSQNDNNKKDLATSGHVALANSDQTKELQSVSTIQAERQNAKQKKLEQRKQALQEQKKHLQDELRQLKTDYHQIVKSVDAEQRNMPTPRPAPATPEPEPTTTEPLSPEEREASQSSVFFPGSAPKPPSDSEDDGKQSGNQHSRSNQGNKSQSQNSSSDSNNDDSQQQNSGMSLDNDGGLGGMDISPIGLFNPGNRNNNDMGIKFTPSQQYDFTYYQNTDDITNPLDKISNNKKLTLKVIQPNANYKSITFCNPQFSSCTNAISLNNESFTINTSNVSTVTSPMQNPGSYLSTPITISDSTSTYLVAYLYFHLNKKDKENNPPKFRVSLPVTKKCTKDSQQNSATCQVKPSSPVTMTISKQ